MLGRGTYVTRSGEVRHIKPKTTTSKPSNSLRSLKTRRAQKLRRYRSTRQTKPSGTTQSKPKPQPKPPVKKKTATKKTEPTHPSVTKGRGLSSPPSVEKSKTQPKPKKRREPEIPGWMKPFEKTSKHRAERQQETLKQTPLKPAPSVEQESKVLQPYRAAKIKVANSDLIKKAEEKLKKESIVYSAGAKVIGVGSQVAETIKQVLPLEKLPAGEEVEEFVSGMAKLPFKGIGSMIQSFAYYELKAKGKEPTPTQLQIIGQKAREAHELQMESFAMEGVGKVARAGLGKISDLIRFRGKEFIPPEKVIKKEVIEGKETFPSPKLQEGSALVKEFKTSPYTKAIDSEVKGVRGFHATAQAGGIRGLGKGLQVHGEVARPHDMPGMYIAPSISPHFLRTGEEAVEYTLLPRVSFKRPGVILAGVKDVERLPPGLRRNIPKAQEFMLKKAERGKAYVTPEFEMGKPEAEAVITPETKMVNVRGRGLLGGKYKYYTEWKGKKIPIYELQAEGVEVATRARGRLLERFKTSSKSMKEYSQEYAFKPERRAVYSPSKYLIGYRGLVGSGSLLAPKTNLFGSSSLTQPFKRSPYTSPFNRSRPPISPSSKPRSTGRSKPKYSGKPSKPSRPSTPSKPKSSKPSSPGREKPTTPYKPSPSTPSTPPYTPYRPYQPRSSLLSPASSSVIRPPTTTTTTRVPKIKRRKGKKQLTGVVRLYEPSFFGYGEMAPIWEPRIVKRWYGV